MRTARNPLLVRGLLDRYAATTARAVEVADRSHESLASRTRETRWLLVVVGLVFVAGQMVPLWLGTALRAGHEATVITREHG